MYSTTKKKYGKCRVEQCEKMQIEREYRSIEEVWRISQKKEEQNK